MCILSFFHLPRFLIIRVVLESRYLKTSSGEGYLQSGIAFMSTLTVFEEILTSIFEAKHDFDDMNCFMVLETWSARES